MLIISFQYFFPSRTFLKIELKGSIKTHQKIPGTAKEFLCHFNFPILEKIGLEFIEITAIN